MCAEKRTVFELLHCSGATEYLEKLFKQQCNHPYMIKINEDMTMALVITTSAIANYAREEFQALKSTRTYGLFVTEVVLLPTP